MGVIYMNNETMCVYHDKKAALHAWYAGGIIRVYVPGVSVPFIWEQE